MAKSDGWSREQLLIAYKLYCEMPFGKMHSRNPEIVRVSTLIGRTPSALAMKLTNIASLDPEIRSSGRKGLTGASQADKDMWNEMTSNWDHFAYEIEEAEHSYTARELLRKSEENDPDGNTDYAGKTRNAIVQARIGQNFFRRAVLSAYEFKCCITGLDVPELLVASHIVPWKEDTNNRLNPMNGLCLSAIHDRAFDIGLISISDDHRLLLSGSLSNGRPGSYISYTFNKYADKKIQLPEKFPPNNEFLKFHRNHIFRG
jgi:putative restriction endonuclease